VSIRLVKPGWFGAWIQRVLLVAALIVPFVLSLSSRAEADSRIHPYGTSDGRASLRPPSYRLRGMGDLVLSIRDDYTRINLWDFAGVTAGAGIDRDSTSLDVWVSGGDGSLDQTQGDGKTEILSTRNLEGAGEGIIRFSETLSMGVNAGVVSQRVAEPYADGLSQSLGQTYAQLMLFGSGRLVGPVLWGLSGIAGSESAARKWWVEERNGSDVNLGAGGTSSRAPNFFVPTDGSLDLLGLGGSLAYWDPRLGTGALYLRYRGEDLVWEQDGERYTYGQSQPRDVTTLGAAFIWDGLGWGELGIDFGREYWETTEDFRFTLSGGSTDKPFQGRGNRAYENRTQEYFKLRLQADVPGTKLTIGGWGATRYDRQHQSPAMSTPNDFNTWVIGAVTRDTLSAPALVKDLVEENRILELGGGGSYKLRQETIIVGTEFWWRRNAVSGTDQDRRPQGWELRLGGEWLINEKWEARLGWNHLDEDRDWLTMLNEWKRDRLSLGGRWYTGAGWALDGYLWTNWWRTAYADPSGPGGTTFDAGLLCTKQF
jgi:hypothetical protein